MPKEIHKSVSEWSNISESNICLNSWIASLPDAGFDAKNKKSLILTISKTNFFTKLSDGEMHYTKDSGYRPTEFRNKPRSGST